MCCNVQPVVCFTGGEEREEGKEEGELGERLGSMAEDMCVDESTYMYMYM